MKLKFWTSDAWLLAPVQRSKIEAEVAARLDRPYVAIKALRRILPYENECTSSGKLIGPFLKTCEFVATSKFSKNIDPEIFATAAIRVLQYSSDDSQKEKVELELKQDQSRSMCGLWRVLVQADYDGKHKLKTLAWQKLQEAAQANPSGIAAIMKTMLRVGGNQAFSANITKNAKALLALIPAKDLQSAMLQLHGIITKRGDEYDHDSWYSPAARTAVADFFIARAQAFFRDSSTQQIFLAFLQTKPELAASLSAWAFEDVMKGISYEQAIHYANIIAEHGTNDQKTKLQGRLLEEAARIASSHPDIAIRFIAALNDSSPEYCVDKQNQICGVIDNVISAQKRKTNYKGQIEAMVFGNRHFPLDDKTKILVALSDFIFTSPASDETKLIAAIEYIRVEGKTVSKDNAMMVRVANVAVKHPVLVDEMLVNASKFSGWFGKQAINSARNHLPEILGEHKSNFVGNVIKAAQNLTFKGMASPRAA